jgi:hypothetical protein
MLSFRLIAIYAGMSLASSGIVGCSDDGGANSGSGASGGGDGSGGSGGSTTSQASERKVLSCSELETKIEADSEAFDVPVEVTLGTWKGVPEELKALPPGAELCGSVDVLDQGLVVSELEGLALEDYYRPVFGGLGCPSFECDVQTRGEQEQYVCSCSGDEHWGSLTTAPDVAYYLLSYE